MGTKKDFNMIALFHNTLAANCKTHLGLWTKFFFGFLLDPFYGERWARVNPTDRQQVISLAFSTNSELQPPQFAAGKPLPPLQHNDASCRKTTAASLQTSSVIDHMCLFCYTDWKKDPHWNPWILEGENIKQQKLCYQRRFSHNVLLIVLEWMGT